MFIFNTSYTPTKGLLLQDVGGTVKARNAAGAMVALSTLSSAARESAKITISAGNFTQQHKADISGLSPAAAAGNYYMAGWEAGQDMETEQPCAWALQWPYRWTGEAESPAVPIVYTLPVDAVASDGGMQRGKITAYQYAALSFTFPGAVDSSGTAIDLDGKTLAFTVYRNPGATNLFVLTSTDGEITVGGDDDNEVTVTTDDDDTAIAGDYEYNLRNMTDDVLLAWGVFSIEAVNDAVEPS